MRTARLLRALAVTALLAAACGSTNSPATGNATPALTPSPTAASSPTQQTPCPPPSNRCLALVTLRGSTQLVVRDITDIGHATTVSQLGSIQNPQFVSSTALSYIDGNNLVTVPLAGSPKTVVAKTTQGVMLFAWSPDGSTVVYTTQSKPGTATVHRLSAGRDQVLGTYPILRGAVGCETVASCAGADTWDIRLSYSPDGAFVSLVESIANITSFRLWSSDGRLLTSSDSQSRSMSAWSGQSFYFPGAKGVEVWRDGVVSSFLPGVDWIRPKASPAGGQIVYEVRDAQGWHHTYVVDTTTRKARELKKGRTQPAFLTSRYIWYEGERACGVSEGCDASHSAIFSGKTYIYDLQAGTETDSIITSVADVWPHAA